MWLDEDKNSEPLMCKCVLCDLYSGSVSVDQTMATWGGSTVETLEGIEEDVNRRSNNRADNTAQQQPQQDNNDNDEQEECDDGEKKYCRN